MKIANLPFLGDYLKKYISYFKNSPVLKEDEQQYTAYLYVIFSLLAISFFGIFAIKPTLDTIANLNKQHNDNDVVEQALKTKINAMNALNTQYTQLQPDLSLVDAAVPASPEIPQLIRKIETLAQVQNLTLQKINIGTVEIYPNNSSTTKTYSFTFQVAVSGDVNKIQQFLYRLISFDRIVNITKVTTGTNVANASGGPSTFIEGRAYFQKE